MAVHIKEKENSTGYIKPLTHTPQQLTQKVCIMTEAQVKQYIHSNMAKIKFQESASC